MQKIFFQSSLPRSGSTLLQNILAQNPHIYATPTSGVLELLIGARVNYTDSPEFKAQDAKVMKKGWQAFTKAGMDAFYNAITDKKYIIAGDFNEPSHLDDSKYGWIISKKFEKAGIIDTYRHIKNKKKVKPVLDTYEYNIEGATCCDNKEPLNRVDYIYTKNVDIKDSAVLDEYRKLSDHLPVLTTITVIT